MRVLLVHPASLWGGDWAVGRRVKPELVSIWSYLRRRGADVSVVDLEAEIGHPGPGGQHEFLSRAEELLGAHPADLVAISAWTTLQYSAAVAVAEIVRRLFPEAVIAIGGYHVATRADDFTYEGSPFNWVIAGEAEEALLQVVQAVARGDRDVSTCRVLEGEPLPLTAENVPDYREYPYAQQVATGLGLYLSRGCGYHCAACLVAPAGGWHAYPVEVALRILDDAATLGPRRLEVLDPQFGYDSTWRGPVLAKLAETYRRAVPLCITTRPESLTRRDLDDIYRGSLQLHLEIDTLSRRLLADTGAAWNPSRYVKQTLDLLRYANAKGIPTEVKLLFNQPGETRATAAETIAVLGELAGALPNASLSLTATPWAYFPGVPAALDADGLAERYGTRIAHPRWWAEAVSSREAAQAVVASRDLADLEPGDDSYWRPGFVEVERMMAAKMTSEARHGLRSHESVGSAARDVPHGFYRPAP